VINMDDSRKRSTDDGSRRRSADDDSRRHGIDAHITAVTAVTTAIIILHSAVDPGDAERREGPSYASLGGVKRHA
jgi:hypothetical protein